MILDNIKGYLWIILVAVMPQTIKWKIENEKKCNFFLLFLLHFKIYLKFSFQISNIKNCDLSKSITY
jgi:hypothetical protein